MKSCPCLVLLPFLLTVLHGAEDIVLNDFEAERYDPWVVTGTAFGPGPANGTLPGQMEVSGFQGKRLVNSFHDGDGSTGTLNSPVFTIQRPFLNFLIGGGGHAGETCLNLLVDGKVVRTAAGPNTEPGGSERLDWSTWEVADLVDREAVLQVVDQATGGWGHINIDQIVLSETRLEPAPARFEFTAEQRYLHLPVKTGAPKRRVKLLADGAPVREFDIELAFNEEPSFIAALDLAPWQGRALVLDAGKRATVDQSPPTFTQSDTLPGEAGIYREAHRPLFHFTSKLGWLNDPNGLVHHNGEWHLYYQHNPYGWNWGNMHWGHAVSTDLFHWKELGDAIFPWSDCVGAAFSGSAVIDHDNTSGFGRDGRPPFIAAFTDTGLGECIAYSHDDGRSFTMFEGNPVVKHEGRDPKVFWHAPTKRWIMALYNELDGKQWITIHSSADLKAWEYHSRLEGWFECPELFELPLDGEATDTRWILFAADGKYAVGQFDGRTFTPEHEGKRQLWHGPFYASQLYNNAPGGRRIQIGWERIEFPGMPFNQQMSVPVELTLSATADGPRLRARPVDEIKALRSATRSLDDFTLANDSRRFEAASEALDLSVRLDRMQCERIDLNLRGRTLGVHPAKSLLTIGDLQVPFTARDGVLDLRILIDRGSIEIFAGEGSAAILSGGLLDPENLTLTATTVGGTATFRDTTIHTLRSCWE